MLFSSFVFVSLFLPLVVGLYFAVPRQFRNHVLLAASIIFYAWGDFDYLWILLGVVLLNYFGALAVDTVGGKNGGVRAKWILGAFVAGNFANLFWFKYSGFVAENVSAVTGWDFAIQRVALPLGISFYTFQGVSYLVDVYRRETMAQRNVLDLALFIAYFPQLVAGPILNYHDVQSQIAHRRESLDHFAYGARRFMVGFAKKMLIANTMGAVADAVFAMQPVHTGPLTAWGGAIAYSLQLYFDFSGYSDMAIGLGAMFGFHFLENFNYPYISSSITEFWRRWHISLSTWFKEYLYIPLGGNRVSKGRNLFNLSVVFLATGIWHGAEWTFVVWGIWHGIFIVFEKLTGWAKTKGNTFDSILHRIYLLGVVIIGWVVFRSDNLPYAWDYLRNMAHCLESTPTRTVGWYFGGLQLTVMVIGIAASTGIFQRICTAKGRFVRPVLDLWLLAMFVLSLAFMAGDTYNPFIYFRF